MSKKLFYLYFILFFSLINFSFCIVKMDFLFSFLYFFFFFILFLFLRSFNINRILPLITASISLLIFSYGIIQKYLFFPLYLKAFASGNLNFPAPYMERIKTGRIFSIFALPTLYSFICSILLVLIFHYFLNSIKTKKILWGSLFLLGIFNLILTQSFASVIYLLAGFSIYLYYSGFFRKEFVAPFLMFLSLFIFITTGTRFSEAKKLEPVKLRVSNWNQSLRIIGDYPLAGVGLGNYKNVIQNYIEKDEARSIYAHNFPLQFTAENGILISLALILLVAVNFRKFTSVRDDSKKLFLPLLAILLLYNIFDIGIYFFSPAFIGVVVLSQLYRKREPLNRTVAISTGVLSLVFLSLFISSGYSKEGELLLKQKKYDRSRNLYKRSVSFNGFDYKNYSGLATIDLLQKKFDRADRNINISLRLNPLSGYSHYVKSKLCQINKKYFSALWHAFMANRFNGENQTYLKWYDYLREQLNGFFKDNGESPGDVR